MCFDCGCGIPNQNWGDERHITKADLGKAAEANGVSVDQVIKNVVSSLQKEKAKTK